MTLEQDIRLLSTVPLFADLGSDHLRLLAFSAIRLELPQGRVLFRADTKALSGFIIMAGEIELSEYEDITQRVLGTYGAGTLLGETALFVETRRPATATATQDSVVIEIDRGLMHRMLTEYPDIAARLHARIVYRLADTVGALKRLHPVFDAIRYPGAS